MFIDVREGGELATQGKIPGAVHPGPRRGARPGVPAPRGLLEFYADPSAPYHKPELGSGKRLVVYCASGGRSALAAKTLKDMGIDKVANMLGGFTAWQQQGGKIER